MENTTIEKKTAGRPKLSRAVELERLKSLVEGLQEKFGPGPYNRKQLQEVAEKNVVGMTLFTSKKKGFGLVTRLNHGSYHIPSTWNVAAPWMIEAE